MARGQTPGRQRRRSRPGQLAEQGRWASRCRRRRPRGRRRAWAGGGAAAAGGRRRRPWPSPSANILLMPRTYGSGTGAVAGFPDEPRVTTAAAVHLPGQLGSRPNAQLAVDASEVGLDGGDAHEQLGGDLAVATAEGDEVGDPDFGGGQLARPQRCDAVKFGRRLGPHGLAPISGEPGPRVREHAGGVVRRPAGAAHDPEQATPRRVEQIAEGLEAPPPRPSASAASASPRPARPGASPRRRPASTHGSAVLRPGRRARRRAASMATSPASALASIHRGAGPCSRGGDIPRVRRATAGVNSTAARRVAPAKRASPRTWAAISVRGGWSWSTPHVRSSAASSLAPALVAEVGAGESGRVTAPTPTPAGCWRRTRPPARRRRGRAPSEVPCVHLHLGELAEPVRPLELDATATEGLPHRLEPLLGLGEWPAHRQCRARKIGGQRPSGVLRGLAARERARSITREAAGRPATSAVDSVPAASISSTGSWFSAAMARASCRMSTPRSSWPRYIPTATRAGRAPGPAAHVVAGLAEGAEKELLAAVDVEIDPLRDRLHVGRAASQLGDQHVDHRGRCRSHRRRPGRRCPRAPGALRPRRRHPA